MRHRHIDPPSRKVLDAFNIKLDPVRLPGGEGNTFLAGEFIVKKAFNEGETIWLAENYPNIKQDGFRLARPVLSVAKEWIVDGWTVQEKLDGHEVRGRWEDKLEVASNLHKALKAYPNPAFMRERGDSYAVANRMAWGEIPLEIHPRLKSYTDKLIPLLKPVSLESQLVHGDLSGNILFASNKTISGSSPAVIDFSLYWRPVEFAAAVIIVDALSWEGANESVIELISSMKEYRQMLVRAELWRILQKGVLLKMKGIDTIDNLEVHLPTVDSIVRLFR